MNNDRLKFRVWDKITKRYFYLELKFGDNGYHTDFIQEPVFEQCTGLKDKNGKLIYEGDLVKIPDDWDEYGWLAGEIREIYYKDGGFRFKPKETTINRGERGHWLEDDGVYEIVGNIHEQKDK